MNFPMENPVFQFFYWMVNTPGVGGVLALLVGTCSILGYTLTLRWIVRERGERDETVYSFPTPALHQHHDDQK